MYACIWTLCTRLSSDTLLQEGVNRRPQLTNFAHPFCLATQCSNCVPAWLSAGPCTPGGLKSTIFSLFNVTFRGQTTVYLSLFPGSVGCSLSVFASRSPALHHRFSHRCFLIFNRDPDRLDWPADARLCVEDAVGLIKKAPEGFAGMMAFE